VGDFMAEGILGQYIYVNPAQQIVIVRLGKDYNFDYWGELFLAVAKVN
jgi:CubicO group peptidase (beta-lactamase class C family)